MRLSRRKAARIRNGIEVAKLHERLVDYVVRGSMDAETFVDFTTSTIPRDSLALLAYIRYVEGAMNRLPIRGGFH